MSAPVGDVGAGGVDGGELDAELDGAVGGDDVLGLGAVEEFLRDVDHPVVSHHHVLQGGGESLGEGGDGA